MQMFIAAVLVIAKKQTNKNKQTPEILQMILKQWMAEQTRCPPQWDTAKE